MLLRFTRCEEEVALDRLLAISDKIWPPYPAWINSAVIGAPPLYTEVA